MPCEVRVRFFRRFGQQSSHARTTALTSSQSRLADTLSAFYDASDRTSEGAMAAHAYKQSVNELDQGIGRELVRLSDTDASRHV